MMAWWAGILALMPTQTAAVAAARPVDTIVVCPTILREALQPWVELREAQGHRLAFVRYSESAEQVRRDVRQLAIGQHVRWLLLVGDVPQREAALHANLATGLGTFYQRANVISKFGPDREIATDNAFADLDDDGAPDLAVGRLTADSPRDLSVMVQKIIDFETAGLGSAARHRVHLVAGVGGFGKLIDGAIEGITKKFITEEIPAAYTTTMTYGSWRSPFCPDPRRFHDVAVDRFNEGGLFWVYIGHGQRTSLDRVQVPGGQFHILDVNDMPKLRAQESSPIAVFLACYTGAFDSQRDCLAEEMLRADGGPVAVISGSRMTMPYAMAVMSSGMMHECFREQRQTIGEVMLHAKLSMLEDIDDPQDPRYTQRKLLNAVASVLTMNANEAMLKEERREHVALFHILGDPLLRLRAPMAADVRITKAAQAGEDLELVIHSPLAGRCTLELACRRDLCKVPVPARAEFDNSENGLNLLHNIYEQANDANWKTVTVQLQGKDLATKIPIPAEAHGPCIVRAHIVGANGEALGATPLFVAAREQADSKN